MDKAVRFLYMRFLGRFSGNTYFVIKQYKEEDDVIIEMHCGYNHWGQGDKIVVRLTPNEAKNE